MSFIKLCSWIFRGIYFFKYPYQSNAIKKKTADLQMKHLFKSVTAGISASLALLPLLGFDFVQFKLTEVNESIVLPIFLCFSAMLSSYLFLKFVHRGGKLAYYAGVPSASFLLFAIFFSVTFTFGRNGVIHLDEFFAGIAVAGFGALVFWRLVLLALGSFILSDLLIEKSMKK